jgi:tricarballylate dehydrogenase
LNGKAKQTYYDVVVVGAGNGALLAALSAHEAGAKVVVLEVAPRALRGGNSYFTGGGFRTVISGLEEVRQLVPDLSEAEVQSMDIPAYTSDQFYSTWVRLSEGLADPELVETVVTQSNPTVHWMKQLGVRWEPYLLHVVRVGGRLKWMPENMILGTKNGGAGLSDTLFDLIEQKGMDLAYETKATKLLVDSRGRVCGVTAKDNEGFRHIRSKAVILACGGFEANREMRAKYLGTKWETARIRGTRYNMGDGIKMALEIGAKPEGQWSKCHATPIDVDAPYIADRAMGDTTNRLSYHLGILVNMNGKRFVDEGEDYQQLTYAKFGEAALDQPHGIAFQLFNAEEESLLEDRYATGVCTRANTIQDLAEKLDIDVSALTRTIDEYNAAVQAGPFNPTIKDGKNTVGIHPPKSNWAKKLDSPPFLGYAVTGGITFTYGGIKINSNAQVIDTEDRVIPGLYAAGELVGGLFYHNYPGGTCLMAGAVFGRLAGACAAELRG